MNLLENVPSEILSVPHWVVWKEEPRGDGRSTKVPYQATDSMLRASSTNPETWNTLSAAIKKSMLIGDHRFKSGTGFVITPDLGMICIDLDDPYKLGANTLNAIQVHEEILRVFSGTYTEISPSGSGYHIWMYGSLPDGRLSVSLKDKVGIEIYAGKRYMTMTGRQYGMCEQLTNQQANLDKLIGLLTHINGGQLPNAESDTGDVEETTDLGRESGLSDAEVVQRAIRMNSRFLEFFNSTPPSDRSRFAKPVAGDLDKISSSPEQILRIMLNSPIGKCYTPEDLERKLFKYWLPEARSSNENILKKREEGRIMQQRMMEAEARRQAEADAQPDEPEVIETADFALPFKNAPRMITRHATTYPPGMIGLLAREIRERATMRASMDFAIASALSLFAGMSGHAYSFERVNGALYMLLLGTSGQGKEAPAEARDTIANQLRGSNVPASVLSGLHGPTKITSPQGLHRRLESDKTLLCILGESTLWLRDLAHAKQNVGIEIKRFVLDLYGKQGKGRVLSPAEILNKDNKLNPIMSPACTLLMEGEPSTYMDLLGSDEYTASGLCARIIHVLGAPDDMPAKNYNATTFSDQIVNDLAHVYHAWYQKVMEQNAYMAIAKTGAHGGSQNINNAYIQVVMTDDCVQHHRGFDRELDFFLRDNVGRVADMFNRVVPNVLRVAVNIAAGLNPFNPVITREVYEWAQAFVIRGLMHMVGQVEKGAVGTGDNRVRQMILEAIERWRELMPKERERRLLTTGQIRGADKRAMLSKLKGIPVAMLQKQVATRSARHVNAERSTMIMKAMLRDLVETGEVSISTGVTEPGCHYAGQVAFLTDDIENFNDTQQSES